MKSVKFLIVTIFLLTNQFTYTQTNHLVSKKDHKSFNVEYKDNLIFDDGSDSITIIIGSLRNEVSKKDLLKLNGHKAISFDDNNILLQDRNVIPIKNNDILEIISYPKNDKYFVTYINKSDNQNIQNNGQIDLSSILNTNSTLKKHFYKEGENILLDAKKLVDRYTKDDSKKLILASYKINLDSSIFMQHIKIGGSNHSSSSIEGNVLSNIAKTDVTNFATGMARFLAERAKQELNESFFDVMRKQMEKLPELQYFFPATYDHLYQMNANLKTLNMTVLRERFKEDVNALPHTIYQTTMNIDTYEGKNLNFLRTFNSFLTTNPNGQWVNLGLNAVLGSGTGLNPKDLFYNFVHGNGVLKDFEVTLGKEGRANEKNLINAIKLVELISNSLLSPDPERYWVNKEEINELFTNEKLFCTYIGLLLAKSDFEEYKVSFGDKSLKSIVQEKFAPGGEIGELKELKNLIQSLFSLYGDVDNTLQALKNSDRSSLADDTYNIYKVFSGTIKEVSVRLDKQKLFGASISFNTEILDKYLNPTVDLAYNIYAKKYSMAINNFAEILGTAGKGDQIEKILQIKDGSEEEKKRVILDYYFTNYKKFSDEILNNLSSDNDLIEILVIKSEHTRDQLISLAKKYKIIKNDVELKKEYLLTDKMLMDNLVKSLMDSSEIAKEYIENFFNDKKKRATMIGSNLYNYITMDSISISKILPALLDSKDFREYLNNSKAYQDFVQKFSKYGTLIGNVATAQNSDEVKAAIQDAVLPVGSSRIKRYANFSIGLNAFVGGFYGQAFYKENGSYQSITSFGVTAPIGVSFAFGTKNFIGKHNALGFNLQLIDLGSLVNFYYKEGDGAQLPAGTKIQLGDILAPGGSISYSLFNSPFSIMGGVQYVPNLSRMSEISTNTDFRPLTWRWHVGLTIDIPLFMIKTYTR